MYNPPPLRQMDRADPCGERLFQGTFIVPKIVLAVPLARWLPAAPRSEAAFVVHGATVREALEDLWRQAPTLRGYVLDDQQALRHHVAAFVDGVVVRDKQTLALPVDPGAEIYLVQALSGGCA
ncbi:MAG: MoaD/ThiS family protein [Gemmataceae bacterium]